MEIFNVTNHVCENGIGHAVHLSQPYNSITATPNSALCSKYVVVLEKLDVLHNAKFNTKLYSKPDVHNDSAEYSSTSHKLRSTQ